MKNLFLLLAVVLTGCVSGDGESPEIAIYHTVESLEPYPIADLFVAGVDPHQIEKIYEMNKNLFEVVSVECKKPEHSGCVIGTGPTYYHFIGRKGDRILLGYK